MVTMCIHLTAYAYPVLVLYEFLSFIFVFYFSNVVYIMYNLRPLDEYCKKNVPHPWFVVCLSDKRLDSSEKKSQTLTPHIECTTNPWVCLLRSNRVKGVKAGSGSTKKGSGYWELELVICCFVDKREASVFADAWISQSRKIESRVGHGLVMAKKYNKAVFCRDTEWSISLFHTRVERLNIKKKYGIK
jgi:hypothetical protein